MTKDSTKYTDKRLREDFAIYLLFDDALEFTLEEVVQAAIEDYPEMRGWAACVIAPGALNSSDVTLGTMRHETDKRWITLTGGPGRMDLDLEFAYGRAHRFRNARDAVARHTSYICLWSKSSGTDLAARFIAARDLTCLGAVFAKLPICTAVYFPNGDVIASPGAWVRAAETACADEWPLSTWISYEVNHYRSPAAGQPVSSCGSVGMAAFNGHEVSFVEAPVLPAEAATWTFSAIWQLLAGGHVFRDSDTTGIEGGDIRVRIRHMQERAYDGTIPQTDCWFLIHPASDFDEMKVFGERTRPPPPEGIDNFMMPKKAFLSRLLGRGQTTESRH